MNRYVPCFLREVPDLYLELGGGISVKLHTKTGSVTPDMLGLDSGDEPPSILVMEDGKIKEEELQSVKKSKEWLMKSFRKKFIKRVRLSSMGNGRKQKESISKHILQKILSVVLDGLLAFTNAYIIK